MREAIGQHPVIAGAAAALGLAALSLPLWTVEPEFDAWVWLVWGRELNGLDLTTNAGEFAIAWKPLPVVIDAVLAFFGDDGAADRWVVLVRASAIAALLLAFRVGSRLAGVAAGIVAALALLLVPGFVFEVAKANSEPLLIALALGAVELHLGGRRTWAFLALGLAALIRPEAWPFLAVYGVLVWRGRPAARPLVAAVALAVPALWFGPDLLESGEPLAGPGRARVGGNTLADSLDDAFGALTLPLWVLVGAGIFTDRPGRLRELSAHPTFVLALLGLGWLALVVGLGALGYIGTERFAVVPAALLCPVAGAGAARVVEEVADRRARAAVAVVLAALAIPLAVDRIDATREGIETIPGAEFEFVLEALGAADGEDRLAACNGDLRVGDGRLVPRLAYELDLPLDRVFPPSQLPLSGSERGLALAEPGRVAERELAQAAASGSGDVALAARTSAWSVYALGCGPP